MKNFIYKAINKILFVSFSFFRIDLLGKMIAANYLAIKLKYLKRQFKNVGQSFFLGKDYFVLNPQYISFGDGFSAKERFRIEAVDKYGDQVFSPSIEIGTNVIFNTDVHIGCVDRVTIGNNVLFASRIYITDHHHGEPVAEALRMSPAKRGLVSKGPVVIKDNVWVGEGVAIMPGVTIGENCIIATNAVVTKDIPANSVAAGIPAQVIKQIQAN